MKFSIRDVLWLTVVVALAVGWTIDRVKLRRAASDALRTASQTQAQAEVTRLNAEMDIHAMRVLLESTRQSGKAEPAGEAGLGADR